MRTWEVIRAALRALRANLVRTALTMLGVVIGVASVVAMLSLGEGARADVESNIRGLGADILTVRPGQDVHGPVRGGTVQTLTRADADALIGLGGVLRVAPTASSVAQVKYLSQNLSAAIVGITPAYYGARGLTVARGVLHEESHERARRRVAVLGSEAAEDLFGALDPVGERVRIKGLSFLVIGVLAAKGESFGSPDGQVMVPLTTHQSVLFGNDFVNSISVQVTDESRIDAVTADIERVLRARHRVPAGAEADFYIRSTQEMLQTMGQVTGVLTALLGGIAAVSLLVGGIGIMNIMLVSVRERTREIGVRMAVGARRRDVLLQFLIESIVVSALGGVVGLLTGALGAWAVSSGLNVSLVIPGYAIVLALLTSLATGVLFGVWPAQHAAHLDPVEALRFE